MGGGRGEEGHYFEKQPAINFDNETSIVGVILYRLVMESIEV